MSSISRHPAHRRRSHSASSPVPSTRPSSTEKWRAASKRPRPSSSRGTSYKDVSPDASTSKWDVDKWRRGKRPRRDGPSPSANSRSPCLFGSSPVFRDQWSPTSPVEMSLPSTSEAFALFPARPRQRRSASHHSSFVSAPAPGTGAEMMTEEVSRLRSTALGELHRHIEESGEAFVSRMQDWEREYGATQASPSFPPRTSDVYSHSEPDAMHSPCWSDSPTNSFDDEDDIQIVSEDSSGAYPSHRPSYPTFDGAMDVDEPSSPPEPVYHCVQARSGSPYGIISSGPSGYATEDETPELTGAFPSPSVSSSTSLPLQHSDGLQPSHAPARLPNSSTEKAIAALTLVMASGAGGLNDYEIVRASDSYPPEEDESLVGEMWH